MQLQSDDWIGRVVGGQYEVLAPLRVESLARVWAGRDERTGRPVEIKLLSPHLSADRERLVRFGREIVASFLVTHPNTLEVLASGEQDGMHFLVSESVEARTLADVLAAGPMDAHRAAAIALQVVRALGAAHQEGVLHRALSPEKILLLDAATSPDGLRDVVKVCDFGLAKLTRGDDDVEVTANEVRVGDAAYMAPEYIGLGRFVGKSDLYAVGALLYRMVGGRPPFTGERDHQLGQHMRAPPPPLGAAAPGAPGWLSSLVAELLAKNPDDRPGVPTVIRRLEDGLGLRPGATPSLVPADRVQGPPPQRSILGTVYLVFVVSLIGVALVSAGAVVAVVWGMPR